MKTSLFDFDLPQALIATHPAKPRTSARLLHVNNGALIDLRVAELPKLLSPKDALVINNTQVFPARFNASRTRGENTATVEVTLADHVSRGVWWAMAKPGRRINVTDTLRILPRSQKEKIIPIIDLVALVREKSADGMFLLDFMASDKDVYTAFLQMGRIPLPPYILKMRPEESSDTLDYQTMFARKMGSVAAPTAGLHFTPELMGEIEKTGCKIFNVTLHVGAGTFLPVKVDDTNNHVMHGEWGYLEESTAAALNAHRAQGGRVLAIGTTALRLLESAASESGELSSYSSKTHIFITPGYRFRAVDRLWTNFHLPCSTLFMLVCAFGDTQHMRHAYAHAIENRYRFYSYGDAMLVEPASVQKAGTPS